jgi:tetratricopeptide (TPR) repeat protein
MASKKKIKKHLHPTTEVKKKADRQATQRVKSKQKRSDQSRWMIPTILAITFIAFIPVLGAGFVSWDDGEYVLQNTAFRNADLKAVLTTPMQGNVHPLTMLTLFINYVVSGENAWSYHLVNLALHLVNCLLVFRLAMSLSRGNRIISFTTAILFGIHPVHVESVAWVSERKDVLYGLFFIAGLMTYTKYVDSNSRKDYWLSILYFVLSLLSKPSAAVFPLALLCVDFLRTRKLTAKVLIEKIPFFTLSLAMGIITFIAQRQAGSFGKIHIDTSNKIFYGFYGIMMYIVKMVAPVNLAVFYPFPAMNVKLPVEYYMAPVFFLGLAFVFFYSLKRNRVISFGILFYLVNLLLVLQFLPVGSAVIAQRYAYIPYIGLFFIVGWIIDRFTNSDTSKAWRIVFPIALLLSVLTWHQASTWHSSATLWDQAIKTQPSAKAYANRALLLRKEKNYDLAIEYFNKAIHLDTHDNELYANRGNVYFDLRKPELAISDYRKALSMKPDFPEALDNMGAQFAMLGQYDSAVIYTTRAITIKPDFKPAYSNRALTYMKLNRFDDAIRDWKKFLEFEPDAADVYNTIGSCYQGMGKYRESLEPINRAISMSPDPTFYLNRSYSYIGLKDFDAAKKDALFAKQHGAQIPNDLAKSVGL